MAGTADRYMSILNGVTALSRANTRITHPDKAVAEVFRVMEVLLREKRARYAEKAII
jgi:hypothetical protein